MATALPSAAKRQCVILHLGPLRDGAGLEPMWTGFHNFVMKGDVVDLAVAGATRPGVPRPVRSAVSDGRRYGQPFLHYRCELSADAFRSGHVCRFNHHPDQGFRSGGPEEHPAGLPEFL